MEKLRWTDKVTALSSLVSTLMTVLIPIGIYFWLDPAVRQAALRKQLLISEEFLFPSGPKDAESLPQEIIWTIINPSELHAEDVIVSIRSIAKGIAVPEVLCDNKELKPQNCIQVSDGYLPSLTNKAGGDFTFKLEAPIPPRAKMRVRLIASAKRNDDYTVYPTFALVANSKNGPAEMLSGGAGW
jgi:hypothetical protein